MKTIGNFLAESRAQKRFSKERLEKETKIKKEFIESLEAEDWESLPDYPVVLGFVKSIVQVLEVDKQKATALLRRDYPPKTLPMNPKPDVSAKFAWNPKTTFVALSALVTVSILGYLGFQYAGFVSPPDLVVERPAQEELVDETILVEGKTDEDATVTVNNQPVLVGEDGSFSVEIEIAPDTEELVIKAVSRSGRETLVTRKIRVQKNE